ncbi:MAG: hypothetical protein GY719_15510 [bacterium]|nr:hypothetical protein [bacterium]
MMIHRVAIALAVTVALTAYSQEGEPKIRPRLEIDVPPVGFETPDCMKIVFRRYCLGGPASKSDLPETDEDSYVWTDGDAVEVSVYQGQVARVSKTYRPATQPTYSRLLGQLREKYGQEEREGRPSLGRRDPRGGNKWRKPGWTLRLAWTADGALYLTYSHDELSEKQRKAELEEL